MQKKIHGFFHITDIMREEKIKDKIYIYRLQYNFSSTICSQLRVYTFKFDKAICGLSGRQISASHVFLRRIVITNILFLYGGTSFLVRGTYCILSNTQSAALQSPVRGSTAISLEAIPLKISRATKVRVFILEISATNFRRAILRSLPGFCVA